MQAHFWSGMLAMAIPAPERSNLAAESFRAAIGLSAEILQHDPSNPTALLVGAQSRQFSGDYDGAIAGYRALLDLQPDHLEAWAGILDVCLSSDRWSEALTTAQRVLELRAHIPDQALSALLTNIGAAELHCGMGPEAERHLIEAVNCQNPRAQAFYNLILVKRFTSSDADYALFRRLDQVLGITPPSLDQVYLLLAKGHIQDHVGLYRDALGSWVAAKNLLDSRFDFAAQHAAFETLAQECTPEFLARIQRLSAGRGYAPIFVVGMPRSNTSVTHQLLSFPANVTGIGEHPVLDAMWNQDLHSGDSFPRRYFHLGEGEIEARRQRYLDALSPEIQDGRQRWVDKHPLNFRSIPLILQLFPEARFIHCRRSPLDTCLSIFSYHYPRSTWPWANNMLQLSRYYVQYHTLMGQLEAAFPERILKVDYPDFIANPAEVAQRLYAFCSLPWRDEYLAFQRNNTPCATASAVQVRRSVTAASLDRSRNYRQWLAPCVSILEQGGIII
jgi:tetratricopeptide (TPR) repeat protein